jgi:hypothetical protein
MGNRGPQDGIGGTTSRTLDADGIWRGWVLYADGSVSWLERTSLTPKWRRYDNVFEDNVFLIENEDSSDDAILGYTNEMDDHGPTLIWD